MFFCFNFKKISALMIFLSLVMILCGFVRAAVPKGDLSDKGVFVPIIMYHSILNNKSRIGEFVISPDILEQDMEYLKDNNYTTIFVQDLVSYVYDGKPLPEKPVIITFDDGFYNNVTYALPLLKKYDMKAVISVVGSYTQKFSDEDAHNTEYSYLTWDDISELSKSGYIEIGNHTYDMHINSNRKGCSKKWGESTQEYSEVLYSDIFKLQKLLTENSGFTPVTFTYPFGFVSKESVPILKKMGFKATLICYEKPNYITKNPDTLFGLNRYNRPSGISTEKFMKKALAE